MKTATCIVGATLAWFATQPYQTVSAAPPTNKVIIVLDASGSMHGKIAGEAKIDIARGVIDTLLKDWDSDTELGITAYGHREKGDCADIETVVPIGKVNHDKVMTVINRLHPKGRTPLTAAVQAAAKELKYTEDKATIILVSDGEESCDADPCRLSKELEEAGVDFTIHVVGFDIKKKEEAKLSCLAANTGGQFLRAKNAAQLNSAIEQTVATVKNERPAGDGAKRLKLHAVLKAGAEPLERGVQWTIYEAAKDLEGKRKKVKWSGYNQGSYSIAVPAGRYFLVTEYGDSKAEAEVEVNPTGLTEATIALNAGVLSVSASLAEGAEKLDKGLQWTFYEAAMDLNGKRKKVKWSGYNQGAYTITLPEGRYVATANYGEAAAATEVEVKANERTEGAVVLDAGVLSVSASLTQGGQALSKGLQWTIYEAEKDLRGERKKVKWSGYNQGGYTITLPKGRYVVAANYGEAVATAELEVKPNQRTEGGVVLGAGMLSLSASAQGGQTLNKGLQWTIYQAQKDLNGKRKQVKWSGYNQGGYKIALPEGRYYVEVLHEKVKSSKELSVTAGELTEEKLLVSNE